MSEELIDQNNENNGEEKEFADLVDSYTQGMNDDLQVGDRITAKVISITDNSVFFDTGSKVDGVCDIAELAGEDGGLSFQVGDSLTLYIVEINDNEVRLSQSLKGDSAHSLLTEAFEQKIPVEGKVKDICKGGFHVDISGRRAFCPFSQMDLNYVESPMDYVGHQLKFLITQLEDKGRNIVVSRKKLLRKDLKKAQKHFYKDLKEGNVYEGRITNLTQYGAFVEIFPGVEGMAHVSELSWGRLDKPTDMFKEGQVIKVKVIGLGKKSKEADNEKEDKKGKKGGQKRIALSVKQANEDPWTEPKKSDGEVLKKGDIISGTVTHMLDFGAFVEISAGIEGLIHVSELSYTQRVAKPEDILSEGDTVTIMVKEVDTKNRRISLSLRDAEGDPFKSLKDKYPKGKIVEGVVEKNEKFGIFINLEPGVTGLLPRSKAVKSQNPDSYDKLKVGDSVKVMIEEVQLQKRKITLAPMDMSDEEDWRKYAKTTDNSLGTLGEKLKEALKTKNSD